MQPGYKLQFNLELKPTLTPRVKPFKNVTTV